MPAPAATTPTVDYELLTGLMPIGQFAPEAIRELASKCSLRQVRSGSCLFEAGDQDDWTVYVIEGQVRVDYGDGAHETIVGCSMASRLPLAPQQPRPGSAHATSDARVLAISSSLLEVLSCPIGDVPDKLQVEEHDAEQLESRLLLHLFQDYVDETLDIPVLPEVALQIRKLMADPDVDIARVAAVASRDPSVAGRLVQVANSPVYRGVAEVKHCRDAIARLGLRTAQQLVTALAVGAVFRTKSTLLRKRMHSLWRHSAKVAASAYVLARATPGLDPETALLAGLVHDVGALAVVSRAEHYAELMDPVALEGAVETLRAQFASLVLRAWGFPEELVKVGLAAKEWHRDDSPVADYADAVIVAQLLVNEGGDAAEDLPDLESVPALRKLGDGDLDARACTEIIARARSERVGIESALVG